ncbi:MAG: hypothetical protein F2837_08820, partial [Actinobacteria bacterium]|nr:hypothetical protein [Actinomycetota bacterium]
MTNRVAMNHRPAAVAVACLILFVAGCGSSESSSPTTTTAAETSQHTFEVDHFAEGAIVGDVATAECTLSGETITTCST